MLKSKSLLSIVAVPLLALLIACGGGGDDDGDNSSGSSGSNGNGSGSSGSGSSSSSSNNPFSDDDCEELLEFANGFGQSFAAGSDVDLDEVTEFWDRLADRSPNEIRSDMRIVADALNDFFEKLDDMNVDFSNPATFTRLTAAQQAELAKAAEAFDSPRVTAALEKVETFFQDRCG